MTNHIAVTFFGPGGTGTTPIATEYIRTFTHEEIAAKKARIARIAGVEYVIASVAHSPAYAA